MLRSLTRVLVQLHYTQKVDFAQLKSELQLHEKNDLTLMKQENDQLRGDVEKLKQRLREEITRTMAGVRLDLNLEKGRIRDESSQQELKIKEVDTRIESEIAGLRTQIEQAKFSILQYLVGVATGAGALLVSLQICSNAMTKSDTIPSYSLPISECSSDYGIVEILMDGPTAYHYGARMTASSTITSPSRQHQHMVVSEIYRDHAVIVRKVELFITTPECTSPLQTPKDVTSALECRGET